MMFRSFIIVSLLTFVEVSMSCNFVENGIVPDVVSTAPPTALTVKFDGTAVNCGNVLTLSQVQNQPQVKWQGNSATYYTLMMVDPDAPSRSDPMYRSWLHWLVVNIPGNQIGSGQTIVPFSPSAPPARSGLHRYVFLLYQQQGRITAPSKTPRRPSFDPSDFTTKNELGDPIAGNFYMTQRGG